jgi:hypothetical protein
MRITSINNTRYDDIFCGLCPLSLGGIQSFHVQRVWKEQYRLYVCLRLLGNVPSSGSSLCMQKTCTVWWPDGLYYICSEYSDRAWCRRLVDYASRICIRSSYFGISYACNRPVHFVNLNSFCARDTRIYGVCSIYFCTYLILQDRLCGLVVRVPGYTTEMYCDSCEVRTEFIYVM